MPTDTDGYRRCNFAEGVSMRSDAHVPACEWQEAKPHSKLGFAGIRKLVRSARRNEEMAAARNAMQPRCTR